MNVAVNGKATDIPEGTTVQALLAGLGVRREGTAVEVNRAVVPRSVHAATVLKAGDCVEIVTLVGGG